MSDPRYPALYQVNTRVWLTGPAAQAISRANPEWHREFVAMLPDLKDEDIAGSGFAIQSYTVHRDRNQFSERWCVPVFCSQREESGKSMNVSLTHALC